MEETHPHEIVN